MVPAANDGQGGLNAPTEQPTPAPASEAEKMRAWCLAEIGGARKVLDQILSVKGGRTPENTLQPFNALAIHLDNAAAAASLYSGVHPDETVRTAGEDCMREVVKFQTDLSLNRELYEAFQALDATGLDPLAKRVVDKTLRDFRRSGVDKDDATRERLKQLADRAVELGQTFDRNIRDDVRKVKLDPAQLAGLPKDYIDAHPIGDDGKVTITTDYPDYIPFRTYARDGAARMALYKEFLNRGWPANDQVMKDLLAVRQEQARLLGYADYADYQLEDKMIGSGKKAREFIDQVAKIALKRAKKDYAALLARKKKDDPKAKEVNGADALYYETLIKREKFALDPQEVRQYFEFPKVRDGLLTITSRLFGVRYEPMPDVPTWHADVTVYDVYDAADGRKLGRIYLDLHPREGKYKHAAQFTLRSGVAGVQLPEGVLVTNMPRGLMEHDDVVTLFHEFGHLMHHVLGGHQPWVRFSGVATEWDFVEAPSQMLEEWAWDHTTLAMFAKKPDGEVIPEALVKRMRAADEFGQGYVARTQMFYASLSLRIHQEKDPSQLDLTKTLVEEQKKYSMFPYVDDTHFFANFGHLNGYGAMYYTYMWSLVIAKDMFSEFQKKGLLDETTARRYRDTVLAPGGSRDAAQLVRDFLGRDYGFDAFRKWLEKGA